MRTGDRAVLQHEYASKIRGDALGIRLRRPAQPEPNHIRPGERRLLERHDEHVDKHHENHLSLAHRTADRDLAQVVHEPLLAHSLRHRLHQQLLVRLVEFVERASCQFLSAVRRRSCLSAQQ